MHLLLQDIVVCPRCRASACDGMQIHNLLCQRCELEFFDLQGLPCWFPSGPAQKLLWEDLLACFVEQCETQEQLHLQALADLSLLGSTQLRLERLYKVRSGACNAIIELLRQAGLKPQKREEIRQPSSPGFSESFELMLRDWGWRALDGQGSEYRHYEDENRQALDAVLRVLPEDAPPPRRVLVIGSGAGRLSWDLHRLLKPELTVALDSNPLLAFVSKLMVNERATLTLPEARLYPHDGLPEDHSWQLRCPPAEAALHDSWQMVAADAWCMPFAAGSFDLVVTPWFADSNGRDFKQLMALVEQLLVPKGLWLNYGPFLYPESLPAGQKYTPEEMRELLELARFELRGEAFTTAPFIHSPLSQRGRLEECWSFVAESAPNRHHRQEAGVCADELLREAPPAWLILPYLPVPRLEQNDLFPEWMSNLTRLIDGKRSIDDLARMLAPSMPDGQDPRDFVYKMFDEFVLQ